MGWGIDALPQLMDCIVNSCVTILLRELYTFLSYRSCKVCI